jgi:hypothetical protein
MSGQPHLAMVSWRHPRLFGPFGADWREPTERDIVSPSLIVPEPGHTTGDLCGVGTLLDGSQVPCACCMIRVSAISDASRPVYGPSISTTSPV